MDIDFESYIRGGEPDKKEKASAWKTAIGLQAVDGLQTSDYLKDTARKHIEGDISIDEVKNLIYRNVLKGIEPDMTFLISFFRNLMMDEKNELKNRYLVIDVPQELISGQDPTSSRQVTNTLTSYSKSG